jgi:two-component system, cell cycle sensor histidine kinase and response regulator CckA
MAGLGVPLSVFSLYMTLSAGQSVSWWQGLEMAGMIATPAVLYLLPASRARVAGSVLVVGFGLTALAGTFNAGPGIGVGIVFCGWVIAAVLFVGGVAMPSIVATAMMVTMWMGDGRLPLGFTWVTGRSSVSWMLSILTVVGTSFGIALAFRRTLDRLRQAVGDEASAREAASRAQLEREEALTRAAQAQRLESLGRLAGGVAHDFNNAIAIIALGVDELREPISDADREQVLADMTRATRGANATTKQLLSFARQGSAPGSRAAPEAVVHGLAASLRRLLPESIHVLVHAAPTGDVLMAVGDLEQALLNLCLNARDAMPDGGTLALHLWASPDGEAVLEVVDSGVGMSADVSARALDPFFTTKGDGRGNGLGLAMVGTSVQRAGGTIEIDSVPGHGTTVRLRLPIAATPADAPPTTSGEMPTRRVTGHVMVLEDEPQLQRLLQRGLERGGHRVTMAGTVGDALMALEAAPAVDLLLTDAVLPDGGPTRLIQAYRARHPDGPVLVCSGYVPSPDLIAGIETDAYAFLQKPFDAATLLATVAPMLRTRAAVRVGG